MLHFFTRVSLGTTTRTNEVHRCLAETLIRVFSVVKYKMLLCLTATLVRVDGMHNYLLQFCPVVDTITMEEAVNNGWISTFKEYKILFLFKNLKEK